MRNYKKLLDLGFVRYDYDDEVHFRETGEALFSLELECPSLDVTLGIDSDIEVFSLYSYKDGDIIKIVPEDEVEHLITLLNNSENAINDIKEKVQKCIQLISTTT